MLEWDHRARYGADYDTRYLGRRMNTWMDPDIRQELLGCWGHLDVVDPAIALRKDHQAVCHGRHARGIGMESP